MKPDANYSINDPLPLCNLHSDCHSNRDGKCTALASADRKDGNCPFYKTSAQFIDGCRISLMNLLKNDRADLIKKYGCLQAYANLLRKAECFGGGDA